MKTRFLLIVGSSLTAMLSAFGQMKPQPASEKIVTDEYFGVKVDDPSRY